MNMDVDLSNEKSVRAILEHSTDVIAVLSVEGEILYVTPSIDTVLGYTIAEAMKLEVFSLTYPEDRETLSAAWEEMLGTPGKVIPVRTYRMKHKDGTWRWIEASIRNNLHDPVLEGVVNIFRDVTDDVTAARQNVFDINNLVALINNTRDIMWSVDRGFKIITANIAFVEIIRQMTGHIISKGDSVFLEGFSKEHYQKYKKIYETVFEGEIVSEIEYLDQPTEVWSEITYYPIWEKDVVIGAACHSKDISEIKKAERNQQFDKKNLEALISSTVDMMWSLDKDLNLITGNQPFLKMMRSFIGKEIVKGENFYTMDLPPEISQELVFRYKGNYQRALAGEVFSVVDHFENPQEMWMQVSYHPIRLDEEIVGVACHSQIITEIKKVEQLRIRNEERLKESQALAKLGHWELDFASGEALWSEESCRIYGLPVDDNIHTFEEWVSFIHPDDFADIMALIEEAQKTLRDTVMRHRIMLRDGTVKHIASKTKFEFDETGKVPVGIYGVAYDITAEKEAEMQLKQKAKELALSNAELEQFAYAVSHDLQEPLRMVTGFLSKLEMKYSGLLDDKAKKYIHFAVDGARRMRQIIIDLLEYSRVGKSNEPLVDVDLNEVVEGIKVLLSNQIDDKKAVVHHVKLPVIRSNKVPLHQIFQNLIGNGLKYTAVGVVPQVKIVAKEGNTHWTISVSDNGIGINESDFDRVFAIFQRLHTKKEYSGTGIGLAITKKIIEQFGGEIWLESEEGRGSIFYFTLPK